MYKPFKAIISDLDGTLLNQEHKIGDFTIETLSKLAQNHIDIFLATGRNYADVKHIIQKVPLKSATLVTSNGAEAHNLAGELLFNHYLPEDLAAELMQIPFDQQRICLNSYQGEDWFINVDVPQLRAYHQDSGYMYNVIDFAHHHGKQTEKIFFIAKKPEDLLPLEQYIQSHYGDQIYMTYSTLYCLEIMAKGVSKASTLEQLIQKRGYTLSDCIAFGDGMNDVEMLSSVGKGCLMANADPRLITKLPHNEIFGLNRDESVASYLRATFGLI